jgi:hypothetical protein
MRPPISPLRSCRWPRSGAARGLHDRVVAFGMQPVIAWEAPLMGWPSVGVRMLSNRSWQSSPVWIATVVYPD